MKKINFTEIGQVRVQDYVHLMELLDFGQEVAIKRVPRGGEDKGFDVFLFTVPVKDKGVVIEP